MCYLVICAMYVYHSFVVTTRTVTDTTSNRVLTSDGHHLHSSTTPTSTDVTCNFTSSSVSGMTGTLPSMSVQFCKK